jgi:outer membrane lipoprotein-sorting protein
MRIYLILFLLAPFNIDADELDVFIAALNKDYLFNEIVYENELAIQKSNGEIIKKMNQFEVHIKKPFEESYYVSETEIDHIDHDLDQKQTIPMDAINNPLIKAFLSSSKKHLNNLDIEIIDNLYLLRTETQTFEFLTKGDQIKKIIFLDNLGYRHEITLTLKDG